MPQYGCFLIFLQIYLATVLAGCRRRRTWQHVPYQGLPPLTLHPVTLVACFTLRPERILSARLLRVTRKSYDSLDDQGINDFLPLGRKTGGVSSITHFNQPIG